MIDAVKFRFGAELEIVTGSRTTAHTDWHYSAQELSEELTKVGIKNHVNKDHNKAAEDYMEWSLIQEVTITNQMMLNQWGMELVSPISDFQRPDIWQQQINIIWWVLEHRFQTTSTQQCSTHIHVSPSQGHWTVEQVKKIAKTAVYFERSIDSLLPPERRASIWCQSNRWNHLLRLQSMATVFQWIDSTESSSHIAFLMCAFSKDSEYGKSVGKTADFPHNVFRWNFTPLTEGLKGTIEFRQPPGSANALDSQLWIQFASSFLQGAIQYADRLDALTSPTLDLLSSFVLNGAAISGVQDLTLLENLFVGKNQLAPGAYDLKTLTTPDLERMRQKAQEANITLAKFKKLFGYK